MDGFEREVQVRRFVDEVWNGRNYETATDLYSQEYSNPCSRPVGQNRTDPPLPRDLP